MVRGIRAEGGEGLQMVFARAGGRKEMSGHHLWLELVAEMLPERRARIKAESKKLHRKYVLFDYRRLLLMFLCILGHLCVHGISGEMLVVRRYYMGMDKVTTNSRDGSFDCPFESFEEAKRAVRSAVADENLRPGIIEVVLKDGRYCITSAITFEREDSGSKRHPVRWRAQSRLGACISGGISIPPFKKLGEKKNLIRLTSRAQKQILMSDISMLSRPEVLDSLGWCKDKVQAELVCGDNVQTLARWPNDSYVNIAPAPGIGHWYEKRQHKISGFAYSDKRIVRWKDEVEARANGYFFHDWASNDIAIERIDSNQKMIWVDANGWQKGMNYGYSREGIWYGYNLLCELDVPGEYFIDKNRHLVYFWPHNDDDIKSCRLTYSDGILRIGKNLSNVTFAGLVFEDCRGDAIRAVSTYDVSFIACVFRNIGLQAFNNFGAWRTRIIGCDFYNIGSGALILCGGCRESLEKANTIIENCHIHHFSTRSLSYAAAIELKGCGFQVLRNTIHDAPHWAIKLDGPENSIISNELYSVCLDCGEMGAIYSYRTWLLDGSQVIANYIHDIYNPRYERNRGIMLDGQSAGVTISSNVFENVAVGISAGSIGNAIVGNAFLNCKPPIEAWPTPITKKKISPSIIDSLSRVRIESAPWKDRNSFLRSALRAMELEGVRPAEIRTEISGNRTTEKTLTYYMRWAPYNELEWCVGSNSVLEKGLPDEKWVKAVKMGAGQYASKFRASSPVRSPITLKCKRLVDERGPGQNGRLLPGK